MATALRIANHLIKKASADDEPICNMRLQKLLYYCQAWSLVIRGASLFREKVARWDHGPVVPEVYHAFKSYGRKPIDPDKVGPDSGLKPDELSLIESVWNAYKCHSALGLREMTHKEDPWLNTKRNAEISHTTMAKYYRQQMQRS